MRILIAADTYYPHVNGASYFTQRLAHYLQKHGHTVAVVAPSQVFAETKERVNGVLVYGLKSIPVFFYKGFRFSAPLLKKSVQKIFDDFKPDIVQPQMHFFIARMVFKVAKARHIPIVATNHFMPENLVHYLPLPTVVTNAIKKLAWSDFSRIFNNADVITTPTETAAKLIRNKLKKPVEVISCGIDLSRFKVSKAGCRAFVARYSIPNKPILLYVGRLDKEKNLDLVLRAVVMALKKVDFHFVIAGTGAERENLEHLVGKLKLKDKVTFAGFVPDKDLPALYNLASCFVIAGIAELQSIVTMEAMASGLPVIGVDAMALPELIHDGVNGFLFKIDDVKGLAERIIKVFSDGGLRAKMSKKSLEIIEKHDIDRTISAFESIYGKVSKKI